MSHYESCKTDPLAGGGGATATAESGGATATAPPAEDPAEDGGGFEPVGETLYRAVELTLPGAVVPVRQWTTVVHRALYSARVFALKAGRRLELVPRLAPAPAARLAAAAAEVANSLGAPAEGRPRAVFRHADMRFTLRLGGTATRARVLRALQTALENLCTSGAGRVQLVAEELRLEHGDLFRESRWTVAPGDDAAGHRVRVEILGVDLERTATELVPALLAGIAEILRGL